MTRKDASPQTKPVRVRHRICGRDNISVLSRLGEGCNHARMECAQESTCDAGPVPQYIHIGETGEMLRSRWQRTKTNSNLLAGANRGNRGRNKSQSILVPRPPFVAKVTPSVGKVSLP